MAVVWNADNHVDEYEMAGHGQHTLPGLGQEDNNWYGERSPDHVDPRQAPQVVHYQHPIPGLEMGRSVLRNLNNVQFSHQIERSGLHAIQASVQGQKAGVLAWDGNPAARRPGRIDIVDVHQSHQRNGLATAMLDIARNHEGIAVKPQHSEERTAYGDAWSRHVGGHRPDTR